MRIRRRCPTSTCRARIDAAPGDAALTACPQCGTALPYNAPAKGAPLERCPGCDGDELYVRKDFPQRLGLASVIATAGLSIFFFARGDLLWALGVLLGLVLIDLVVYTLVPRVTVCYRCGSEFRDVPVNPRHAGFDLATAEKYRQPDA